MSKTIEQIRAELDAKIPRDVISQRDAGFGGKKLSYLEGWYVIDRMNQVFGQGNWSYHLAELTKTFEGDVNGKFYVSYIARVELFVRFPGENGYETFIDVGFGDGQDSKNPGKCHELAVKEAVTDGIKRCAKSLGMSLGLALYDKTQENVEDEPGELPKGNTERSAGLNTVSAPAPSTRRAVVEANTAAQESGAKVGASPDTLKALIKNAVKVLDAQKKVSIVQFKKLLQTTYKVEKVDELNAAQVTDVIAGLKKDYPELRLTV